MEPSFRLGIGQKLKNKNENLLVRKNKKAATISVNPAKNKHWKGLLWLVKTPATLPGPTPVQRIRALMALVALALTNLRPMQDQTLSKKRAEKEIKMAPQQYDSIW